VEQFDLPLPSYNPLLNRYNQPMSEELDLSPRIIVDTNGAPKAIGPYSQAVRAGNLLFTSGQIALHQETQQVVGSDIKEQATQVFANLKAILEAGGSGFAQVIKATVFLKNFDDFAAMNTIYAEHLAAAGTQPPARTTVEVSRLPKDVLVEIDLVALIS
jgi:2-iminobutanoate/2-iminopropanoate deaminase